MGSTSNDVSSILFNFEDGVSNVVNFDEDNEEDSDGTLLDDEFEDQFVRPTTDRSSPRVQLPASVEEKRLDSFSHNGRTYRPGKTVELLDGDFLRITAILPHRHPQGVLLKGLTFRRNKLLEGLLELKRNEVTMLLSFDEHDSRDIYHQSVHIVELAEVIRIRELVKTNQLFPALSFRESDPSVRNKGKDYILQFGRLVCRTKLVQSSKNEGCLQYLEEDEADNGCAADPLQMRCDFRGETEKGGACSQWLNGEEEFDEAERERSRNIDVLGFHSPQINATTAGVGNVMDLTGDGLNRSRRYTLGDAFCGAGGASRGAKAACLRVDWGFDFDPAAIDSYRKNLHRARCEAIAAHDFVTVINEDFRVDVLHLSPPCQTFSPFHVHAGKNDELNQATFFAVEGLLMQIKPRIVTLEETFGLTALLKHQQWFRSMIQTFSRLGFSVRWKVFNLCEFGLPQPRKRLFLFASCPGEPLPTFPAPTHCKAADHHRFPHLLPFTTVNNVIGRIPRGYSLHNPDHMSRYDQAPYNGNLPFRRTICGPTNHYYHPSGKRLFTVRELACLQGFPLEHQFDPLRARMQIGNAVPPIVAKVFFDHIRKHLLKVDGLA